MIKAFGDQIIRFRKDERGVFLVIFALLALVLIATSGAVVDFTRVQQARTRAQIAADAAALALQGTINNNGVTAATLKVAAQALMTERIADTSVTAVVESATPDTTAGKLTISGYIIVPTYFTSLVGVTSMRSAVLSEVTRSSSDLEVSMALDVTQSMSGTKISALITSTNSLIDQVVQTTQTPTYSKMALAPYSMAVNLGNYVDEARGAAVGGKAVTNAKWSDTALQNITISSITKSPNGSTATVINFSNAQNFTAGDYIWIANSSGISNSVWNLHGVYRVGTVAGDKKSFTLKKSDNTNHYSNGYSGTYSSGGRVTKCLNAMCELVVTANAHGIANAEKVYVTGGSGYQTSGTYQFTGKVWTVESVATNTYIVDGTDPRMITTGVGSNYVGTGGTSYCVKYGCSYYHYENRNNNWNLYRATDCVVERPSTTDPYTDGNPTDTPVGFYYNSSGNDCLGKEILPLTSSRDDLHAVVNGLTVAGSTAGQIGLAWAWYMISPNFIDKDLETAWPATGVPAAYGKANLIKAVILMTDGIFNTMYDHGVPSSDSSSLSGGDSVRSVNNSPLGDSITQATALCNAIKTPANKTTLYTVGFDIGSNSAEDVAARNFLSGCATPGGYFYQADDADDLQDAFDAIASSLSELRLSK
jgi:Flp pilus assembly protein TadG